MRFWLPLAGIAFFFSACDNDRVYETNQDFTDRTWKVNDTVQFHFSIKDPGVKYNILYSVRNSLEYPYARLFVTWHLQDSTGKELEKKLISGYLFDEKTGRPTGTSGLGDIYDHRFLLTSDYEFRQPGKYYVTLQQFMRADTLEGVLAVGVRIEKSAGTK
jgi:gliding motility-associated lipoprotein GldH